MKELLMNPSFYDAGSSFGSNYEQNILELRFAAQRGYGSQGQDKGKTRKISMFLFVKFLVTY